MDNSASIIESVIGEFLMEKECVIIPHFGALMTTPTSASIDKERQAIHPPGTEVVFNSGLTSNDGLLAQRLADRERLSFAEALNKLQKQVDAWKNQLANGYQVRLAGIGKFDLQGSASTCFTPDKRAAFRPDTYGYNTVGLTPVKRSNKPLKKVKKHSKGKETRKRLTPSPLILTPVSILIAALLLTIGLNVPVFNFEDGPKGSLAPLDQANSMAVSQSATTKVQASTESAVKGLQKQRFHVIAGSFKHKQNAHQRVTELEKRGYQPAILNSSNGFHRVSVKHFQDSMKAKDLVQDFKKDKQEPNAWLLKTSKEPNKQ